MSKKTTEITATTMSLKEAMESFENLSLRKLAVALDVNYSMLLKASKMPIPNEVYDPDATNYAAIEMYIRKKHPDDLIDYSEIASQDLNATIKLPFKPEVNQVFTIRGTDVEHTMIHVTPTHVVFQAVDSTQPRVMSMNTFMHQTPKLVVKE